MENLVIIPTYKEIENIEEIIEVVFSQKITFDILVVDDASPDGTAQKVESLQERYPQRLFLLNRSKKEGLGTAYVAGFRWALSRGYQYIFQMDADFSHHPKDLKHLLKACKNGADVSIGSRYVKGVNVVNWPLSRVLLSYFASMYARFITRMNVMDMTAGFVCYQRKVLESIDLSKIQFVGYAFQIEMKFRAFNQGFQIKEVPIIFTDRTKGTSKMSKGIIMEGVFGVIQLKCKQLLNRL